MSSIMLKAYQYRIYPTKSQTTILNQTLETCRLVYNDTLALKRTVWDKEHRNVSLFETNNQLPQWKKEHPELKKVHSQVLQNVQLRVDLAFKSFYKRCKTGDNPGYPRFKQTGRYNSITYPQTGYCICGNGVVFSKIGKIKTIFHRPMDGVVKTITIRKNTNKKWFISIVCEEVSKKLLPELKECVGIDVGLKSFAVFSNGHIIKNPKFYQREQTNLAKVQRRVSKCTLGSTERKIAKKSVSRVYERITNKREDFTQKLSHALIKQYGVICFEDLNIKDMVQDHRFSKGILDASWNKLVKYTTYKAEDAGRVVVLVNPKNTTQMCSQCGQIVAKDISVRVHDCPHCGYKADRDLNAAINIMRLGLQSLAKA